MHKTIWRPGLRSGPHSAPLVSGEGLVGDLAGRLAGQPDAIYSKLTASHENCGLATSRP